MLRTLHSIADELPLLESRYDYQAITYTLTRSKRKTASIYVERNGSVSVRVPLEFTDPQVEALFERKQYWIHKHLAEWRLLNQAQVERAFVSGEGFLYMRRTYRRRLDVPLSSPFTSAHLCEYLVDFVDVELLRVEGAAVPSKQFFVIRIRRIADHF